jgi:hypothetical protein
MSHTRRRCGETPLASVLAPCASLLDASDWALQTQSQRDPAAAQYNPKSQLDAVTVGNGEQTPPRFACDSQHFSLRHANAATQHFRSGLANLSQFSAAGGVAA